MKCVFCKKGDTEVSNSRKARHDTAVWRRRHCLSCGEMFTTEEKLSYDAFFVIKRNLSRRRFVYEKLFSSILHSIGGGKGQDMGDDAMKAKKLTEEVISILLSSSGGSKYISTKEIIRTVYASLLKEERFHAERYKFYSLFRLKVLEKTA